MLKALALLMLCASVSEAQIIVCRRHNTIIYQTPIVAESSPSPYTQGPVAVSYGDGYGIATFYRYPQRYRMQCGRNGCRWVSQ